MTSLKVKGAYITLYAFFITKESEKMIEKANQWGKDIAERLKVEFLLDDAIRYQKTTLESRVEAYPYDDDCRVVYVVLKAEGPNDNVDVVQLWNDLSTKLLGNKWELCPFGKVDDLLAQELPDELYKRVCNEKISQNLIEELKSKVVSQELSRSTFQEFILRTQFFGYTVFFGAETVEGTIDNCLEHIKLPFLSQPKNPPTRVSKSHGWGDLYQLSWRQTGKRKYYPQVYAALSISEQFRGQENIPPTYSAKSLDKIELNLHKCYYYMDFYRNIGTNDQNPLKTGLNNTLKNITEQLIPPTPKELVALSTAYVAFPYNLSTKTITRTNLETNKENLISSLTRMGFQPNSDPIYADHINRIEQMITQIKADITHDTAANEELKIQLDTLNTSSQLLVETRERLRDQALAWLGLGLGLVQGWQIVQGIFNTIAPLSKFFLPTSIIVLLNKDITLVVIDILFLISLTVGLWIKTRKLFPSTSGQPKLKGPSQLQLQAGGK